MQTSMNIGNNISMVQNMKLSPEQKVPKPHPLFYPLYNKRQGYIVLETKSTQATPLNWPSVQYKARISSSGNKQDNEHFNFFFFLNLGSGCQV
jgi:hypothetical protein